MRHFLITGSRAIFSNSGSGLVRPRSKWVCRYVLATGPPSLRRRLFHTYLPRFQLVRFRGVRGPADSPESSGDGPCARIVPGAEAADRSSEGSELVCPSSPHWRRSDSLRQPIVPSVSPNELPR